jgi:phospholipid-binding lipoprotein MlaA
MSRVRLAMVFAVAAALASSLSCSYTHTAASGSETLPAPRNQADNDPLERVNRKIFWFNDKVDVYALEPVATGWDKITPDPVQRSVSNFFTNLRFPIVAVNNLLQGKVAESASDVGRFGVNVTFGALGFFDPASSFGLARHSEDFGQTLGWWGVPPGPYLVLPLLGPSNPRDTGGLVADYAASVVPFFVNQWILFGTRVGNIVNARSLVLKEVRDAKQASLDYYTFVRNAHFQRREALVNDSTELTHEDDKDLYDLHDPDLDGAGDANE